MDNALLIGLSRQMTLRREMDIVANNVANVNTVGFKNDQPVFQTYMMEVARADSFQRPDRTLNYVIDQRSHIDLGTGQLDNTGNQLDVAIQGDGYFVVQTKDGERLTRAGNFTLNNDGELVTHSGLKVMTDGGPVTFSSSETRITIGSDGIISTSQGNRGKLKVVMPKDPNSVRKVGDNLFSTTTALEPAGKMRVVQGAIERSNVSAVVEMTRMIEVTRAYQSVTTMMDRTQDLRRNAIDKLAQVG